MRLKREYVDIPASGRTEAGLRPAVRSIGRKATVDKSRVPARDRHYQTPQEFVVESPGRQYGQSHVANVEATAREEESVRKAEARFAETCRRARSRVPKVGARAPKGIKVF